MNATTITGIFLVIAGIYVLAGLLFVIPFHKYGLTAIDESAHGSGWGFRFIISPGIIIFWPFLLSRWRKALREKASKSNSSN